SAAEARDENFQQLTVESIKTLCINIVECECFLHEFVCALGVMHESVVSHPPEESVRDSRSASGASSYFLDRALVQRELENMGCPCDDVFELKVFVKFEVGSESKAVA